MRSGSRDGYQWMEFRQARLTLVEDIVRLHAGGVLCITSFDSEPIEPTAEQLDSGWTSRGDVLISPRLTPYTEIPSSGKCDEWYIFEKHAEFPAEFSIFASYLGLSLGSVEPDQKSDPDWDDAFDWLQPPETQFWHQLSQIRPVTYVALSQKWDTVVTRKAGLLKLLRGTS